MKRAGIITVHNAYNYGAVLQSYATQKAIEKLNIDCEIIDYDAPKFSEDRKMFVSPNSIYNIIQDLRTIASLKSVVKRKNEFENFMAHNYKLSTQKYFCENDFKSSVFNYDYYITGSDQTFCLHLRGDSNEMKPFFLENALNGKKISYAPSMGEKFGEITDEEKKWLADRFRGYDSLSVREEKSVDFIKELAGISPTLVIDPTLLLDKTEWEKIAKPTKYDKDEYIFFYTVLSDKWVIDYVKFVSKITGLKIIAPHPQNRYEIGAKFIRASEYGPEKFISLIKNAKIVITTSFHATAFSINYNVPFQTLLLGEGNRLSSLLKTVKLEDRIIKENDNRQFSEKDFNIDFTPANQSLIIEREKSLAYLKKALEIEE